MQILMSDAAFERVSKRLTDTSLDIVTMDLAGAVMRAGKPVPKDTIDPEVFWLSLDLFRSGQLPHFFSRILEGQRGKWAQIFAAGIDNPVFAQMMAKKIRLTKSSAQAPAIAEYVLCHALSLLHPIARARENQSAHVWKQVGFREIASTRWLLVGYGAIGTEIARRLKAFGAYLTVVRRQTSHDSLADEMRRPSDLPQLLPNADVVVLACALNASTRGLAGTSFFADMKPDSIFINIGRGALVDEEALKMSLTQARPGFAVLDVFQQEPLPPDSWFWDHPQVHVTAHCSGAGNGVMNRGDALFLENLRRYRACEPLLHEASPSEVGL